MRVETQDGVALHVTRRGDGVPCVYLHEGPGYWSYSFEQYAGPLLEKDLEMIYLDQRGCGQSNHDSNKDYSLDRLILDLEDVRRSLGIDEWLVMGHSFGGVLAINYAYRFPERVKGLMLSNCTVNLKDSLAYQIKKGTELLQQEAQFPVDTSEELGDGLRDDPAFWRSVLREVEFMKDLSSYTTYIDAPTLLMSGREDHAIGPDHYQHFKFPNQTVEILEGKYLPNMENRATFQQVICSFVKQIPKEAVKA